MNTSFVYFDLGNVLLHFDHEIACQNIANLVDRTPEEVRRVVFESDLQENYETGQVDDDQFHEAICEELSCDCELEALKQAASDIFQLNVEMIPVLAKLNQNGVRMGILSNTCSAHWDFVTDGRYRILPEMFDEFILSYEVKSMKPDLGIYEAATESAGVDADAIFFMDDRMENVEGAKAAGLNAVHFQSARQLAQELFAQGLPV